MVDFIALCIYDKTLLIVSYLGRAYAVTRLTLVHVLLFKFPGKHAHFDLDKFPIMSRVYLCYYSLLAHVH